MEIKGTLNPDQLNSYAEMEFNQLTNIREEMKIPHDLLNILDKLSELGWSGVQTSNGEIFSPETLKEMVTQAFNLAIQKIKTPFKDSDFEQVKDQI